MPPIPAGARRRNFAPPFAPLTQEAVTVCDGTGVVGHVLFSDTCLAHEDVSADGLLAHARRDFETCCRQARQLRSVAEAARARVSLAQVTLGFGDHCVGTLERGAQSLELQVARPVRLDLLERARAPGAARVPAAAPPQRAFFKCNGAAARERSTRALLRVARRHDFLCALARGQLAAGARRARAVVEHLFLVAVELGDCLIVTLIMQLFPALLRVHHSVLSARAKWRAKCEFLKIY